MPDKITFTSAVLRGFSRNGDGGKATFSASLTQEVMKAMAWSDVPDCFSGASLEGDLHATVAELIPSEAELKRHGLELTVSRVNKFETIRLELEGKKGKGHRTELRFSVTFSDQKGCRKLEEYMLTIGEGRSRFVVSYTKQEVLPGVEDEDKQEPLTPSQRRRAAGDEG